MDRYTVFVTSSVPDGGIHRFDLGQDGSLSSRGIHRADRPTYMARRGDRLYVLLRAPEAGNAYGGAMALRIGENGSLGAMGGAQSLGAEGACHLALSPSGRHLVSANYSSGTVSQLPIAPDGQLGSLNRLVRHAGRSVHPERQTGPHAHCAVFTPDGRHLCVVDLGLDRIFLYAFDDTGRIEPAARSSCAMEAGTGPRHLVFSREGNLAYCANELKSSVTVLKYRDGRLEPAATYPTLPAAYAGESYCAAVRLSPCEMRLYVSNRGHDSIACYAIEGERLRLFDVAGCGGRWPRDFDLSPDGGTLVCANERSNDVTVFRVDRDTGGLAATGFKERLASPLCVVFHPGA